MVPEKGRKMVVVWCGDFFPLVSSVNTLGQNGDYKNNVTSEVHAAQLSYSKCCSNTANAFATNHLIDIMLFYVLLLCNVM